METILLILSKDTGERAAKKAKKYDGSGENRGCFLGTFRFYFDG